MEAPDSPTTENIVNKTNYSIELFNVKNNQTRKITVSMIFISLSDHKNRDYDQINIFSCKDEGFFYQAITDNFYAEYQKFRQPHEVEGWRFRTKGAQANAQVSGMAVSMGMGLSAYLIERTDEKTFKKADISDLVDIFEHDETISEHDTVIAQQAFHKLMWRGTIESARKRGVDENLLNYVMGK